MKIGINGYEAVVPRFGYDKKTGLPVRVGSGEYCFEILTWLNRTDKKNEYFVYLPIMPTADSPRKANRWHYKIITKKTVWTLFDLSLTFFLNKEKIDVFFSPTHYLPLFVPVASVISILDLSYVHFPELFKKRDLWQLKLWSKYSVAKSKKIITISESSKNDIIEYYKVSEEKVVVVYPGVKEISNIKYQISNMDKVKGKYGIKGNYILFVGTLQPRKNVARLIEAFARVKKNNLELVIIGKKGWMFEEIMSAPKKFGVEGRVRFLENVSDEDLPVFYQNAVCFVLPSLYEGFGLPILEAMKYGCPVLASKVSSLPEAGGNAVLYFDPYDVNDVASKIEKVLADNKLRKEMIEKGYEQVKKFSWEKAARETLKVLEEVTK